MMVKLSLVAAFVMTMATLTFAASALPMPDAEVMAAETTVASIGTIQTNAQVRKFAIPAGVTPDAAVELMASL
jgi:hypothetical protein